MARQGKERGLIDPVSDRTTKTAAVEGKSKIVHESETHESLIGGGTAPPIVQVTSTVGRSSHAAMGSLRHLLRRNALAAWAVIAAALLMKAIVPAGFMPVMTTSGMAMLWCPGMTEVAPAPTAAQASMAMPGMTHHAAPTHHKQGEQAPTKSESPCAFAGLTAPSLGGADIVLLAIAFAAIVAAALRFTPIAPIARRAFLRPPLRGPPAHA